MSLLQQVFIKDTTGKKTVAQHLKEIDPTAKIVQFMRYAVGEGIEKKKDDFAEEVAKMVS
jgi:elongation factor Ts